MSENDEAQETKIEREKINQETAEIKWSELQRYFAAGRVVHVDDSLDLVDVALYFTRDDAHKIKSLRDAHACDFVADEQAKSWIDSDAIVWAVVVKPWVLVQERLLGQAKK